MHLVSSIFSRFTGVVEEEPDHFRVVSESICPTHRRPPQDRVNSITAYYWTVHSIWPITRRCIQLLVFNWIMYSMTVAQLGAYRYHHTILYYLAVYQHTKIDTVQIDYTKLLSSLNSTPLLSSPQNTVYELTSVGAYQYKWMPV